MFSIAETRCIRRQHVGAHLPAGSGYQHKRKAMLNEVPAPCETCQAVHSQIGIPQFHHVQNWVSIVGCTNGNVMNHG